MTKKRTLILISIILGLIVFLIIVATNQAPSQERYDLPPLPETSKPKQDNLSVDLEKAYMSGCVSSPEWQDYCQCTFDELDRQLTQEELIALGLEFEQTEEMPEEFNIAVNRCIYLIEY